MAATADGSGLPCVLGVALGAVNVAANWAGRTWRESFRRAMTLLLPAALVYIVGDAVMIARTVDGTPPRPAAVIIKGLF